MDSTAAGLDAQFNRAVDIVQSLPKGGTIQTTYEDKLWLYSLYKQAIEGDVAVPRPGMLDLLGKAKWDAWNRQKGIDKPQAKRLYVSALVKILRKYADAEDVQRYLQILEPESESEHLPAAPHIPSCPASPASSASSYHSSQASPALLPQSNNSPIVLPHDVSSLAPPLPPPDDAPNLIRPPSHHSPHPSLSSSMQGQKTEVLRAVGRTSKDGNARDHGPSTARNLASESREHAGMPLDRIPGVEREAVSSKPGSVHSPRRQRRDSQASAQLASPLPHTTVGSRDFLGTPETMNSPLLGLNQPTPTYSRRPGSTSTFPNSQAINIPYTLQQIQTSLTALHERLSTLERTQALILRRDEKRKSWFSWEGHESEELDNCENDHAKEMWGRTGVTTVTKVKGKKKSISMRVIWFLVRTLRRALMDVGIGMMVTFIVIMVLNGGWGGARWMILKYKERLRRFLTEQ
ncbi:long-chain fatty acid transporter [Cryptococcus neoformans]|nr:long-chain fatty acid transporter [Cryptococcus neoformans var. grubii Bt120]OXG50377.1 long-chain fatty acid transporter [Cryptococcus neoformans var. grubii Th84]OXH11806.1 long-chain fatty acid transporter [Cryptococcus neoformans var. grubii]OXH32714.1 long-chain fatty acid transporter [Cryptococcus neoformans var. grubii]OXH53087.1 long-chain fatty acid transporter [Cryptococcus neoformans var. grubii]